MGKCNVVIDFGNGKTKISAFEKEGNKFVLTTGAIIETDVPVVTYPLRTFTNLY